MSFAKTFKSYLGAEKLDAATWAREGMASLVVFLVALPLCMGIAIASGVPPALGLISGILGGVVVGALAGCRLQVSGPAAGLAVIVWELVQTHGIVMLGPIVLLAGLIQIAAGVLRVGQWFRAVSPAVIQGMLAGIGLLIFAGQFHVMVDDKPRGSGVLNLLSIPEALYKGVFPVDGSPHHQAALIGLVTIVVLVAWNTFRPHRLKLLPGSLLGVLAGTLTAAIFGLEVRFVEVPAKLWEATNMLPRELWGSVLSGKIFLAAASMALVASAETLLCAGAVDQMQTGPRTKYDQELIAQGVGNTLAGILGALPITGVIVRSSANIDAGATTRLSAIFHGVLLLVAVVLLPSLLAHIPTSSLAAVLVFTGYKLLNFGGLRVMWRFSRMEATLFIITAVGVVATDLLTGVVIGFACALIRQAARFASVEASVTQDGDRATVHISGFATFLSLPRLAKALDTVPEVSEVKVDFGGLAWVDHACLELLGSWGRIRASKGATVHLDLEGLRERYHIGSRPNSVRFVQPPPQENVG